MPEALADARGVAGGVGDVGFVVGVELDRGGGRGGVREGGDVGRAGGGAVARGDAAGGEREGCEGARGVRADGLAVRELPARTMPAVSGDEAGLFAGRWLPVNVFLERTVGVPYAGCWIQHSSRRVDTVAMQGCVEDITSREHIRCLSQPENTWCRVAIFSMPKNSRHDGNTVVRVWPEHLRARGAKRQSHLMLDASEMSSIPWTHNTFQFRRQGEREQLS